MVVQRKIRIIIIICNCPFNSLMFDVRCFTSAVEQLESQTSESEPSDVQNVSADERPLVVSAGKTCEKNEMFLLRFPLVSGFIQTGNKSLQVKES